MFLRFIVKTEMKSDFRENLISRIKSVSYTHLDVYKRQVLHSADAVICRECNIDIKGITDIFSNQSVIKFR